MQTVAIVIHLMIVAVLIGAVLLQKSEGGGLGMGGGAGFMSSRGTANLLTRTTAVLAVGFFVTSLFLSWYAGYDRKPSSIIGTGAPAQSQQPATPSAPISAPTSGGILDSLKKADEQQGQHAPAGPQAPRSQ
ncbi:preprotein translocase subunit SecG [Bradyrhizobium sp. ISRA443]|uniref:preprotein translocase subunit SecG n=1 Tax=unclassified Bradyrhizobium TaxID=2631580 RepID=UPI002478D445|nr:MULTISPECIES: preprotein translocase subunit SecG [unclassified Bradyrhizobium]WGR92001.1 preprotein translocase subunit SecG [Bradyrhizobium sp. ISRA435]WGS02424.1 preprotein translocase subunit SecG [Bradyrhizobium sp. ISRA436]WGS09309.1 preprotein translocase subunit SecG [Bradyrhizobium sp. ISRA437]WGS16198.1 preprotein translocase subunit SecG [Bradyrhizobium sp. ISRA443]